MTKDDKNQEIVDYLVAIKKLATDGCYDFVPRRKNMLSLMQCGMTIDDAIDELLELTIGNYYSGPQMDRDNNRCGEVWVFKKNVDGKTFYIKTKIDTQGSEDVVKILSFHEDE